MIENSESWVIFNSLAISLIVTHQSAWIIHPTASILRKVLSGRPTCIQLKTFIADTNLASFFLKLSIYSHTLLWHKQLSPNCCAILQIISPGFYSSELRKCITAHISFLVQSDNWVFIFNLSLAIAVTELNNKTPLASIYKRLLSYS